MYKDIYMFDIFILKIQLIFWLIIIKLYHFLKIRIYKDKLIKNIKLTVSDSISSSKWYIWLGYRNIKKNKKKDNYKNIF